MLTKDASFKNLVKLPIDYFESFGKLMGLLRE